MPKSEPQQQPEQHAGSLRASDNAAPGAARSSTPASPMTARLLQLQRAAGNRAVQRLVNASQPPVQRLGEEDEPYSLYQPMPAAPAAAPAAAAAGQPPGYGVYQAAGDLGGGAAAAAAAAPAGQPPGYGVYQAAGDLGGGGAAAAAAAAPAGQPPGYGVYQAAGDLGGGGAAAAAPAAGAAGQPPGYGVYRAAGDLGGGGAAAAAAAPAGQPAGYGVYRAAGDLGGGAGGGAAGPGPGPAAGPAAAGPGGLAPLSLPAKYHGEEREVGWRAHFGMDENTPADQRARADVVARSTRLVTKYNTPEETAANTLTPRATADGGAALTTAAGATADVRRTEYVMGPGGQVVGNLGGQQYEMHPDQRRNIHHSTMMAGGDVAHAGHIGVAGGQVNYLDDDSGHYRPDEAHTFAAFNELARQGVLNPDSAAGRVNLVDKTKDKGMGRGASASVHFSGYQQAGGNEQMIRNRGALMGDLLRSTPRYEGPARAAEPDADAGGALEFVPDAAPPAAADAAPAPGPAAAPADPSYAPVAGLPRAAAAPSYSAVPSAPPAAPTAAPASADPSYAPVSGLPAASGGAAAAPAPYSPYSPYMPMPAAPAAASAPAAPAPGGGAASATATATPTALPPQYVEYKPFEE